MNSMQLWFDGTALVRPLALFLAEYRLAASAPIIVGLILALFPNGKISYALWGVAAAFAVTLLGASALALGILR